MPNSIATLGQQYEILSGTGIQEEVRITFTGTSGAGAIGSKTLFTVTGIVAIKPIAFCEVNVAGAGTIELGTALTSAGLLAQVADATDIDAGDIWHDATPDASVELSSVITEKIVSQDVILKITTAALTAGRLRIVLLWRPISSNGNVVSAISPGISASPSLSPSASVSASISPSASASRSVSPSSSVSPSASASPSSSESVSASRSLSPSASASRSLSPSASASRSLSPSASVSRSLSPSASASVSYSPSASRSASLSPSASVSPSASTSPGTGL